MVDFSTEAYDEKGVEVYTNNRPPIPGQSLTASPDEPRPFESPPEFTNFREALNSVTTELLQEEVYIPLIEAIGSGIPLTDLAMQILYEGFREGKWNPDLLMLLVEPLIFVLMALAEKSGIDYRLTGDEEDDLDAEEEAELGNRKAKNLASLMKEKVGETSSIPKGAVPSEVMEKIESLDIPPSLLEKPTAQPQEENLLGRTE